jgi:hypothetical protein
LLSFWLALGSLCSLAIVGLGVPLQSVHERRLVGAWLAVATAPWRSVGWSPAPRTALVIAVAGLVVAWVGAALQILQRAPSPGVLWLAVGAWASPFVIAPPFLSRDAYAYVAQGQVLRQGFDPYRVSVARLGVHSSALQAVDPRWRHTIPPYGPVALRIEQLCSWLGFGREWQSLVALRVLVVFCVVASLVMIRAGSPLAARPAITWLVCSPLVLLQLIAACHLEALLCLLLVAGIVQVRRGRYVVAAVMFATAVEIKVTALAAVVLLGVFAYRKHGHKALLRVLGGTGVSVAIGSSLLINDPFGWVAGLASSGRSWAPATPSSTLFLAIADLAKRLDVPVNRAVLPVCQLVVLLTGAFVLCRMARRASGQTLAWWVGTTTLVALLAAPLLWPWYLTPVPFLMLQAGRPLPALLVGAVPALAALPVQTVVSQRVTVLAELAAALCVAWWYRRSLMPGARSKGAQRTLWSGRPPAVTERAARSRRKPEVVAWRELLRPQDLALAQPLVGELPRATTV